MLSPKTLNMIGLGMQSIGAIALYTQIWGKRWGFAFDTGPGMMVDKHGYWIIAIECGWIIYILSYIPFFLAVNYSN